MPEGQTTPGTAAATQWTSLDRVPIGSCGQIREVQADQAAVERLMAMGLCTGRHVEVLRHGDPLILRVVGSRIGVSARLAARVRVATCKDGECPRR